MRTLSEIYQDFKTKTKIIPEELDFLRQAVSTYVLLSANFGPEFTNAGFLASKILEEISGPTSARGSARPHSM